MPNKIADYRRKVNYIEEKENWDILVKVAKKNRTRPSTIIRAAVHQMCQKLLENPKTRFIQPIFDEPPKKASSSVPNEKKFRVFCPCCGGDHRVPNSSVGSYKTCKDCGHLFLVQKRSRN
jgi:hypothetical protein